MAAIAFFPFEFVEIPEVRCAFTSRRGGLSEPPHDSANISFEVGDDEERVKRNRRLIHDRFELDGWCECIQVHGDTVRVDPEPTAPETPPVFEGDGLTTSTPGIGLLSKVADCQPILLAHRSGMHIAALHAGWRGNKINFPANGVRKFCDAYGLSPEDVFAVRGPSLSPAAAEFVNFEDDFGPGFKEYFNPQTKTVDLWRMTRDQLMEAGVPKAQIHSVDLCTLGNDDTFFSYRKACASPEKSTGRQAGVIWIQKK